MKIGLHANQLDFRGNSTVLFDYAVALSEIIGVEPVIISSKQKSTHPIEKFGRFKINLYNDHQELPGIIDTEKIDVLYMTKAGNKDGITPVNCKTAIHCVFDMREPHGDVYAGVSKWLAEYFNRSQWVPHIVNLPETRKNLRAELNIPPNAFVIGRLGGYDQFDVPCSHIAIQKALEKRDDIWAIFLNTRPFIEHSRVKFIDFNPDVVYKREFINTCDAMIHARSDGETFGLSVAEFSAANKPVLTYDAPYWWYMRAHIDMLGEKAILYKNENDLLEYLLQIDKKYVEDVNWDCYSFKFSPKNVIKQFQSVFLL